MRRKWIWTAVLLTVAVAPLWPQAGSGEPPSDDGVNSETTPIPAQGPDQAVQTQANEPRYAEQPSPYDLFPNRRSYFIAGVTVAEDAQVDPANNLPSSDTSAFSTTKVYGTFLLSRIDRRFNTHVDYKGGQFFFNNSTAPLHTSEVQQFTGSERITGSRTNLLLQESFSDYPAASFGSSAFGGASSYDLGFGGGTNTGISDFFGFNDYGGLGSAPHFSSVSLAEGIGQLTARSSISLIGAYALTDYLGHGNSVNSQQTSALAGYSYLLGPRSSLFLSYGYQGFKYPGHGGKITANTIQLGYQRTLTSRLGLTLSVGPTFISSTSTSDIIIGPVTIPVTLTSRQTSVSATASLSYQVERGVLGLSYDRLTTGGSGFYGGATTDVASVSYSQPVSPLWTASVGAGFSRLGSLGNPAVGTGGDSFEYGFASLALQRRVGQHLTFTASYQFSDETSRSSCTASSGCAGLTKVHTAFLSLTWRTLPHRLGREKDRWTDVTTTENQGNETKDSPAPSP